jgi:hypothetical protein
LLRELVTTEAEMASRAVIAMKALRRAQTAGKAARRMFSDAPLPGKRAEKFGVRAASYG